MADVPKPSELLVKPADHLQGARAEVISAQVQAATTDVTRGTRASTVDTRFSTPGNHSTNAGTLELGARSLAGAPSAFVSELGKDIFDSSRQEATAQRAIFGVGIGVGTTTLLRVSPKAAMVIGAIALAKQGYDTVSSLVGFAESARNATSEQDRQHLVDRTSLSMGRSLAHTVEISPAIVLGGYGATKVVGTPKLYSDVAYGASERFAFIGPGTQKVSGVSLGEGRVDAVALATRFSERHKFEGVEVGSAYKVAGEKFGRAATGTESTLSAIPGASRPNTIPLHFHRPSVGAHPGPEDIVATEGLGIIRSGQNTSYYVGQRSEFNGLRGPDRQSFSPQLRMLHINETEGTAQRVVATLDGQGKNWVAGERTALDYEAAIKSLRNIDARRPWEQISTIRPAIKH